MASDNLALKIKTIRLNMGLTLQEFGEIVGHASKGLVNNWEKGVNRPNRRRMKIIADMMGITVSELLGEGGDAA